MSTPVFKNPLGVRVILLIFLTVSVLIVMEYWSQYVDSLRKGIAGRTNATYAPQKGAGYLSDGVLSQDGNIRHCISDQVIGFTDRKYAKKVLNKNPLTSSGGEESANRRKSFKEVFDDKTWLKVKGAQPDPAYNGIQASGSGSSIRAAQEVMAALHVFIDHIKLQHRLDRVRLLDIPCGDMAWMSRLLETRPDVDYIGFDIVPDLIDNHRKLYANKHPNWQFYLVDVVSEGINSTFRDINLVLSRHMLQHLTTSDALTVLGHISDVGRRQKTPVYFFTTTWSRYKDNGELRGDDKFRFRPLNLELPPFSLEPPLCLLNDGRVPDMLCCYIGLWRLPLYQVGECKTIANGVHKTIGFADVPFYSCVSWTLEPKQSA